MIYFYYFGGGFDMLSIDKSIIDTNEVICNNISTLKGLDRGLMSQNILSQLRNLVEYIAMKIISDGNDIDPKNYKKRKACLEKLKGRGDLRFLYRFHELLQISVSHYTENGDGSERLMLKYYEYLIRVKNFLKEKFDLDLLQNIQEFPIHQDRQLSDYYLRIAERIKNPSSKNVPVEYTDRYYIQKIKPFFVDEEIYYEVTFNMAYSKTSKFDRVIAFTKEEVNENYAIKFSMRSDTIRVLNKDMSILIIDRFEVAIRPCEIENYSRIFGENLSCNTNSNEYKFLMRFLTINKMSLVEIVSSNLDFYNNIKSIILQRSEKSKIFNILDKSRNIIVNDKAGANVLRYLLLKMNNRIIKSQLATASCYRLSNLYLEYGCIPFDQMPFCSSLKFHNPRQYDVLESISFEGREHELLAQKVKNNTEIERQIFTPVNDLGEINEIEELIKKYNECLYTPKHNSRRLKVFKDYVYIEQYVTDTIEIVTQLQDYSSEGIQHYEYSVQSWLRETTHSIDDDKKREALLNMFSDSKVAFIYGSAGTGKTRLIEHVSHFFAA